MRLRNSEILKKVCRHSCTVYAHVCRILRYLSVSQCQYLVHPNTSLAAPILPSLSSSRNPVVSVPLGIPAALHLGNMILIHAPAAAWIFASQYETVSPEQVFVNALQAWCIDLTSQSYKSSSLATSCHPSYLIALLHSSLYSLPLWAVVDLSA